MTVFRTACGALSVPCTDAGSVYPPHIGKLLYRMPIFSVILRIIRSLLHIVLTVLCIVRLFMRIAGSLFNAAGTPLPPRARLTCDGFRCIIARYICP